MCPLNPALDRVFRIGGSLPSLGDGSTEKIPLLVLVDLVRRTNAERGPWVSRQGQLQTFLWTCSTFYWAWGHVGQAALSSGNPDDVQHGAGEISPNRDPSANPAPCVLPSVLSEAGLSIFSLIP